LKYLGAVSDSEAAKWGRTITTKDTQAVIRDSKAGEFLTQRQADRKDSATWERERIHHPKK
jgi:hypothetical protein